MRRSRSGPVSIPEEESKIKQNIVADGEEEAYRSKASGMGQTKGLSFVTAQEEDKQENRRSLPNE